ncbi:hypothetical protein F4804DRAFT_307525 [Jackrogersella minutella]|nr:hypothetical protein F4804DRAFT_307525 [Jackrogersella minutella]
MDGPRKRGSPCDSEDDQGLGSKRQRLDGTDSRPATSDAITPTPASGVVSPPAAYDLGRDGLRRSIAIMLEGMGYDSARKDALEGFTEAADAYATRFVDHVKRSTNASRRNQPLPIDFEQALEAFNIPLSSIEPHLNHPIPKEKLTPNFFNPIQENVQNMVEPRPDLGEEFSGQKEKDARPWIPQHFPQFPPPHAYKYTPYKQVVDHSEERAKAEADAKKAERALRNINRAARISRQKELRMIAQRDQLSKERQEAWENMMTRLLPKTGPVNGMSEIADHSTIVNYAARYGRKGVAPKASRRSQPNAPNGPA